MSTPTSPLSTPEHPPASVDRAFPAGTPVEFSEKSRATMWDHIKPTMTCWIWHGYVDQDGYGQYLGRPAHRVVYERLICEVPVDLQLDHLCRNRLCVNPAHLEPVTLAENMRRSWAYRVKPKSKSHCINGHEYTPKDFRPNGRRKCRECQREYDRKRHLARRENKQPPLPVLPAAEA